MANGHSSYSSMVVLDQMINIDVILWRFSEDRRRILMMLAREGKSETIDITSKLWEDILSRDLICTSALVSPRTLVPGKYQFLCSACQIVANLSRSRHSKVGKIVIETGSMSGRELVVEQYAATNIFLEMEQTQSQELPIRRFYCDPFSAGILTSSILEAAFKTTGMPFLRVYTAFICGKHGYYLVDNTNNSPGKIPGDIQSRVAKGLLMQLFSICHLLSQFRYSADMVAVGYDWVGINYLYENTVVTSPIILCLSLHYGASITATLGDQQISIVSSRSNASANNRLPLAATVEAMRRRRVTLSSCEALVSLLLAEWLSIMPIPRELLSHISTGELVEVAGRSALVLLPDAVARGWTFLKK